MQLGAVIKFVLQLLPDTLSVADVALKIFLASQPKMCIREAFDIMLPAQQQHLVFHHTEDSIVNQGLAV